MSKLPCAKAFKDFALLSRVSSWYLRKFRGNRTRDTEFTEALRKALPAEALKGWFEVFNAARQRG